MNVIFGKSPQHFWPHPSQAATVLNLSKANKNKKNNIHCTAFKSLDVPYRLNNMTYGLLTKCEVKMAASWPSSFFCVFMDRDGVTVHKLEKRTKPTSSHLDHTNLVNKGFIINKAFGKIFSCGTWQVVRGGWIGVCKSADPLKLMAESVDPLKKSTKSESANCLPR